jgi:hypothetical protein
MPNEKQQIDSLSTLVSGVRLAQSRGAYSLEEAADLCAAVRTFTDPPKVASRPADDVVAAKRKPGRPKNS